MTRLALLTIWMALSGSVWAGNFFVKLDKQEVALGQMAILTLEAVDLKGSLEALDTLPLAADFEIYNVSSSRFTETRGKRTISRQQLEISLFPAHAGKIKLPGFLFGGRKSQPVFLNVLDSTAAIPRVLIKSGVSAPKLYQREESILYVDAYHDGTLQWRNPPKVTGTGFYLRPLPDSEREETVDGVTYRVKRFAWGMTPLGFGTLAMTLSPIEAGKFGERLRYAVPTLAREVNPVPAYLPVPLHIGKLSIASDPLPATLKTGHLLQWTLELRGKGLSQDGLRKFLVLPGENRFLFFYAPEIAIRPADDSAHGVADPGMQLARITIPFKPLEGGVSPFPGIRIPYYDPEGARMGAVALPPRTVTIVNPLWEKVKMAIYIMGGLVLGLYLIKRAIPYCRERLDRRRWIRSLEILPDSAAFYKLLRQGSGRFFVPGGGVGEPLLNRLDRCCYGQEKCLNFNELKSECIAALRNNPIPAKPASPYHKNVSVLFKPANS